jgi:hypothetical protein
MEHLEGIHTERFYRNLISDNDADFIDKRIEGKTEDGSIVYYDFDDAAIESKNDGTTLSEYGEAFYYKEGKVYQLIIYFQDGQCTAANLLSFGEIKELVQEVLKTLYRGNEELLLEEKPWTQKYLIEI